MQARMYWLWLSTRRGISTRTIADLVREVGTPEFLYTATTAQIQAFDMLSAEQLAVMADKDLTAVHQIVDTCASQQVEIITMDDSNYPSMLHTLLDPPCVLYVKGHLPDFAVNPAICIVGTRSASMYGMAMARKFTAALCKAGFSVVIDPALGIETVVMRTALVNSSNLVVVQAGGVDQAYPPPNRFLLGDVAMLGGILSENPPGTPNDSFRFGARSRLLSGLSHCVLVIEASVKSGTLITVRNALDQGRRVFAVPFNLDAPNQGGNHLISTGEATLVLDPMQMVRELQDELRLQPDYRMMAKTFLGEKQAEALDYTALIPQSMRKSKPRRKKEKADNTPNPAQTSTPPQTAPAAPVAAPTAIPAHLTGIAKTMAQLIFEGNHTADAIGQKTGMPPADVMAQLTLLEIEGIVDNQQGVFHLNPTT